MRMEEISRLWIFFFFLNFYLLLFFLLFFIACFFLLVNIKDTVEFRFGGMLSLGSCFFSVLESVVPALTLMRYFGI